MMRWILTGAAKKVKRKVLYSQSNIPPLNFFFSFFLFTSLLRVKVVNQQSINQSFILIMVDYRGQLLGERIYNFLTIAFGVSRRMFYCCLLSLYNAKLFIYICRQWRGLWAM